MAGIYIHIPYCKQACHYCDFHFSTNRESKSSFVAALLKEMEWQRDYLHGEKIETIYFGGGTPSLLGESELKIVFERLSQLFSIHSAAEITLEANPDDLSEEKISDLKSSPVNRLSIGIQSFFEKDLRWMNRAHNADQAQGCVKRAQDAGFENITIDLMYGLPGSTNEEWQENLERAFNLNVQHLSCYALTVEPRTALAHFISTGKSKPVNEEQAAQQFEILMQRMKEKNWLHYEISNFASPSPTLPPGKIGINAGERVLSRESQVLPFGEDLGGAFISQHNSSYWKGKKYLGLGPSAHSFDGSSRQWNVSNNQQYIDSIFRREIPFEKEILTEVQRVNERIMTELRTMWGLRIPDFGFMISDLLREKSKAFVAEGLLKFKDDALILTDRGKMIADKIILELMMD